MPPTTSSADAARRSTTTATVCAVLNTPTALATALSTAPRKSNPSLLLRPPLRRCLVERPTATPCSGLAAEEMEASLCSSTPSFQDATRPSSQASRMETVIRPLSAMTSLRPSAARPGLWPWPSSQRRHQTRLRGQPLSANRRLHLPQAPTTFSDASKSTASWESLAASSPLRSRFFPPRLLSRPVPLPAAAASSHCRLWLSALEGRCP